MEMSQNNWRLISGKFTATASFDRVELRWAQEQGFGVVDDVQLCQIAGRPRPTAGKTVPLGILIGVAVLIAGGVGVGVQRWRSVARPGDVIDR
jgi:hypothetical protein